MKLEARWDNAGETSSQSAKWLRWERMAMSLLSAEAILYLF